MQATRRFWAVVNLATVLLIGAWILDEPFLLVGAAAIGASLVARQLLFVHGVARLPDELEVTQSVSRDEISVETDVNVVLRTNLPYPAPYSLSITASPPIAAKGTTEEERTVDVAVGDTQDSTDFSLQFPVAGEYRFSEPRVSIRDPEGLFETTLPIGSTPGVTVRPGVPENIQVGIRGEQVTTSLGAEKTGNRAIGFEPAEIREFVPGDTLRHVDWKATARMNSLHVREFEQKTDISNVLIVDHRSSMGTGKPGRTKLDFGRQVALRLVMNAQVTDTPCGLYGVGDEGLTVQETPSVTEQHFKHLRTVLLEFSPTESSQSNHGRTNRFGGPSHFSATPEAARKATNRLGSSSAFDAHLIPFLETRSPYLTSLGEKPLYQTVRSQLSNVRETVVAVIFTDDTHRNELREAIKVAQRRYDQVVVFVTPTVLFEPTELAELSQSYEKYVGFENFRKRLASANNVSVYEVGPQDRLTSILSNGAALRQPRQEVSR